MPPRHFSRWYTKVKACFAVDGLAGRSSLVVSLAGAPGMALFLAGADTACTDAHQCAYRRAIPRKSRSAGKQREYFATESGRQCRVKSGYLPHGDVRRLCRPCESCVAQSRGTHAAKVSDQNPHDVDEAEPQPSRAFQHPVRACVALGSQRRIRFPM